MCVCVFIGVYWLLLIVGWYCLVLLFFGCDVFFVRFSFLVCGILFGRVSVGCVDRVRLVFFCLDLGVCFFFYSLLFRGLCSSLRYVGVR